MARAWLVGGVRRSAVAAAVALLAVTPIAAACARGEAASDDDGRLDVVAGFFPLADAAARVGGDAVDVRNLTPPGVEPHDLELVPDDLAAIQSADVVLLVGGGFQPAVEDAAADAEGIVIDVLDGLETLAAPSGRDDHAEEGTEDESEGEVDPHVWLDPGRFALVVDEVVASLGDADPARAEDFAESGATYRRDVQALDEEFARGLADCERTLLVTSHAAFGYLAQAYGLMQEPIAGIEPESEPDPARLAELTELVRREGVTTIFTEELVSPEVATTLADEAGVDTAVLSTLESAPEDGGDYLAAMRENLQTLRLGLGCA